VTFRRIYQQLFTAGNLICKNITELYNESIPFLLEGISTAPGVERLLSTMLLPASISRFATKHTPAYNDNLGFGYRTDKK